MEKKNRHLQLPFVGKYTNVRQKLNILAKLFNLA